MPFALPVSTLRRLVAAAMLPIAAACGSETEPQARPNLLLVTVDTLRADFGGARTPRLDALAAGGLRFTAAESTSSWTLPSLVSLMTATETSTHGCWDRTSALDGSFETLAERLKGAGYHTGAVASHVFLAPKYGLAQGFADYDTALVKSLMASHEAISSPKVTRRSLRWLDGRADDTRPFLLWSHYFDPHDVYHAHDGFPADGAGERGLYKSEVTFTDHWIGELLAGLEERGLDEDTIVLMVSDHGEEFGEHGATRHGHTLYGELTRVPLILRLPARLAERHGIGQGRDVDELVSIVELMPTLLELCDVAGGDPERMAGGSLVPLLAGERPGDDPRRGVALSELRLRAGRHADALVDGDLKLVRWADGRRELYDLAGDPGETTNLAAERPEELARLEATLDARILLAEGRAGLFGAAGELDLSPAELQNLADLGYVDDE